MHKMKSFPGCNRLYEIWHNYPTNPIGSSGKNDGKFCFDEEKNYVEKVFFWNIQPENSLEQQCTHGQGRGRVPLNTLYCGRNKHKLLFQTTWCPTNNFLLLPMMSPQTKTIKKAEVISFNIFCKEEIKKYVNLRLYKIYISILLCTPKHTATTEDYRAFNLHL